MRVLLTRDFPGQVVDRARERFDAVLREDGPLGAEEARAALGEHDAILTTIGDDWGPRSFVEGPRCRLLANFGVGHDHIDTAAAGRAGVMVTNTPGPTTEPTADVAMMLVLMSARRAGAGERLVRSGGWTGWGPGGARMGMHLGGRTLGIVGMGRIGQAVARRARAHGMEVVFHNRSAKAVEGARQLDSLHEVMAAADVVAVCVPGGAETRGMIDAAALGAMRGHAHLVNVSRGDVVDEAALIEALEAGRIGGAGLDVYAREPEVPEGLMREDTVLLPHIGTADEGVRAAMGMTAFENLVAFAEGREPPDRVA
jgi:lactate dehydrogenase-like 2-hydroxyacid dehydrogenase